MVKQFANKINKNLIYLLHLRNYFLFSKRNLIVSK